MSNGLLIAEGLITINDEEFPIIIIMNVKNMNEYECNEFSIIIMNVNDCDVNLCDGTALSTVVESHVNCDEFNLSRWM